MMVRKQKSDTIHEIALNNTKPVFVLFRVVSWIVCFGLPGRQLGSVLFHRNISLL